MFLSDVTTHPCHKSRWGLTKPLWKITHGWVIASHFCITVITCPCPSPNDGSAHRLHSRQVTGARCTEVAARQSWAKYSSRPTMHSRRQGWAIKDFSVLSKICSICEQPLYGIMLMILHTNKWCVLISDQNLQIFLKSIWKIHSASGHSHSPFTSCRTRPLWHNGSSLGPHVLNGYGSMTLVTTNTIYGKGDPALVDMWGTSYQNMKYQSSLRRRIITGGSEKAVRVSRRMDCRIGVIEFYVSANN